MLDEGEEGTVIHVGRYRVEFRGQVTPADDLHDLGADIVDALDDALVDEPFVHTDSDAGVVRIEVVVTAPDQTAALQDGLVAIVSALHEVGVVDERSVLEPSARAEDLVGA